MKTSNFGLHQYDFTYIYIGKTMINISTNLSTIIQGLSNLQVCKLQSLQTYDRLSYSPRIYIIKIEMLFFFFSSSWNSCLHRSNQLLWDCRREVGHSFSSTVCRSSHNRGQNSRGSQLCFRSCWNPWWNWPTLCMHSIYIYPPDHIQWLNLKLQLF